MAGKPKFDGFISTRADSFAAGVALKDSLRVGTPRIAAAIHDDCERVNPDHMAAANDLINGSAFAVILLGPSRLIPSVDPKLKCYQLPEIEAIWQRALHNRHEGGSFETFLVLLQDAAGNPSNEHYAAQLRKDEHASSGLLEWLCNSSKHFIREFDDPGSALRREDLEDLAAKIRIGVRLDRPSKPQKAAALSVPDLETAYLKESIKRWRDGMVGDDDKRKGGDRAFAFQPERFVEFTGVGDGGADEIAKTRALSHWLFRTQDHPLLLVGEGGSGKTTALAAAACGFAAAWGNPMRNHSKSLAGGQWLKQSEDELAENGGKRYVPVLMRCADLVAEIGAAPSSDQLASAVLGHMYAAAGEPRSVSAADRELLLRRFAEQAYVLLLDGLDEIADAGAARNLFKAAADLAVDFRDADLRAIFTVRPGHNLGVAATEVSMVAPLSSWELIETFIARFAAANGGADAGELRDRLTEQARKIWDLGDGRNAPLKTPLMLNAFCCIAHEHHQDDTLGAYESSFCARLIDYFIRGRKFPALAASLQDPANETQTVRKVLRRFALACLRVARKPEMAEDDAKKWLSEAAAGLGMTGVNEAKALKILRELAAQTGLFGSVNKRFGFYNAAVLGEFLAAEEMAGAELKPFERDAESSASWSKAFAFAQRIRAKTAGAGAALEMPRELIRRAADADADAALQTSLKALGLLEGSGEDLTAVFGVLEAAAGVYRQWSGVWPAKERAAFAAKFFGAVRLESTRETAAAVEHALDIFLAPRTPWIAMAFDGAPESYAIADTPVLVAQYRCFVDDVEWREAAGFWEHAPSETARALIKGSSCHNDWVLQMERPGSPVVNVTWYEAVAYCRWLTLRAHASGVLPAGQEYRLPAESEWRAMMLWAAQGNTYLWGDEPLSDNPERVNWLYADVDHASAPGVFAPPAFARVFDLGSNVACWAVPSDALAVWPPALKRHAAAGGGSWVDSQERVFRASARLRGPDPMRREADIGFRLVRAPLQT